MQSDTYRSSMEAVCFHFLESRIQQNLPKVSKHQIARCHIAVENAKLQEPQISRKLYNLQSPEIANVCDYSIGSEVLMCIINTTKGAFVAVILIPFTSGFCVRWVQCWEIVYKPAMFYTKLLLFSVLLVTF